MTKMKVGLLIPSLRTGGAEGVVSRLSELLKETYDIHLIIYSQKDQFYEVDTEIICLNSEPTTNIFKKIYLFYSRIHKLKNIKQNYNLDLVLSFMNGPNVINVLSKVGSCTCGVSIRNYIKLENKSTFYTRVTDVFIRNLYHKADFICPVSNQIKNMLIKDYLIDEKKIHTIYNPYNIEKLNELAEEPINDYGDYILSVGRLTYQKGYWHLIKAFNLLHKDHSELKLVIIGKGSLEDKLLNLIEDLGLSDSIILLGHKKNPYKYMKHAKAFVLSSLFEGFPNALVEAMICKVPVVSTDCNSGPREIFEYEGETLSGFVPTKYGILVQKLEMKMNFEVSYSAGDYALKDALGYLLNHDEYRAACIKSCQNRVKNFSYEQTELKYNKLFEQYSRG